MTTDDHYMKLALAAAKLAEENGEVPVGAVLVKDNQVLATAFNQPILQHDPTAHAEILVLREAAAKLQNYRLPGATLYVTLEPCAMCVGAMLHARIKRLVFGAYDQKVGAVSSVLQLPDLKGLNHRLEWRGGVAEFEAARLLRDFFAKRRG